MGRVGKKLKTNRIKKTLGDYMKLVSKDEISNDSKSHINGFLPNFAITSVLHILIVPDTKDPRQQSPFQGYLTELFDEKYINLMNLMSILPTTANEVYMNSDELLQFRNGYSISNYLILDVSSFKKRIFAFEGFPFIYCYCVDEDYANFVKETCNHFKYPPKTVGWEGCDLSIDDNFRTFSLDNSIIDRLEIVKANGDLPQKAQDFFRIRSRRDSILVDIDQESYSHAVSNPNEAILYGLGFNLPNKNRLKGRSDRKVYIDAIINSSEAVRDIVNKHPKNPIKSDLILYCPSIFTFLYDFNSQFWNQIKRQEKSKVSRDFIIKGLFKNPNYSGFDIDLKNDKELKELQKSHIAQQLVMIRFFELALSSSAINFLCVSNNAPAIRLPNKINFFHSNLRDIESLSKSDKQQSLLKLKRKFEQFTKSMKDEIGNEICEFIVGNSRSLTLCTDSTIEWVPFDRIPLMFTHEISKINTTPGNKFLQESTNIASFSVSKEKLKKITIIRSFKDDDPVKLHLQTAIEHYIKLDNTISVEFIDVNSSDELVKAIDKSDCGILIFDCHGNHGGSESHGWLKIGDECVDTWFLPVVYPPIVILSACLTSAIGGSHASVANGFLSNGCLSVLGTLLPVDAAKSAIFIGRLILRVGIYLDALQKLKVEVINWRQFMSGLLRMSFCTEFLTMLRDDAEIIPSEKYEDIKFACNNIINAQLHDWYDRVLDVIHTHTGFEVSELDEKIQNIGLTETMYYSQLGRPEGIIIDLTV